MSEIHNELRQVTYKCNDKQQHINTSVLPRFVNQQREAYEVFKFISKPMLVRMGSREVTWGNFIFIFKNSIKSLYTGIQNFEQAIGTLVES